MNENNVSIWAKPCETFHFRKVIFWVFCFLVPVQAEGTVLKRPSATPNPPMKSFALDVYGVLANPTLDSAITAVLKQQSKLQSSGPAALERDSSQRTQENLISHHLIGSFGPSTPIVPICRNRSVSASHITINDGGLSRSIDDIQRYIRRRIPGLENLYNKYLRQKPGFEGKIVVTLSISPEGKIIEITKKSSRTGFSSFDEEFVRLVSRFHFNPVRSGSTNVTIFFTLTSC